MFKFRVQRAAALVLRQSMSAKAMKLCAAAVARNLIRAGSAAQPVSYEQRRNTNMKKSITIDAHYCDQCDNKQDHMDTCQACGTEHCYECQKTHGKTYMHSCCCSGSGDGYYCKVCDDKLTATGTNARHTAYRLIESLRHESEAWCDDFEKRRTEAEATLAAIRPNTPD